MIYDVISPSGIEHRVEEVQGSWFGHENMMWGLTGDGHEIIRDVLGALLFNRPLPHGFKRKEPA